MNQTQRIIQTTTESIRDRNYCNLVDNGLDPGRAYDHAFGNDLIFDEDEVLYDSSEVEQAVFDPQVLQANF